ncbi:MAG: multidrug ABC transporter permease [Bacteroidetes bacterium GWF2_42_66]|nr:MAG: multidrug ABC transporter permease [Bacteroidetes bacterium GWA2_42_15]OFY02173.1 MAG: multidrug ABC transporter permease [Bacteroidetes bacterium GWE2_42_39]OFY43620.1 MAG: multidrug ABC transporter permease [Bacteroidetes bacterium GWF2_42_66]HBL75253.1 multidrug ABC transporter permease [Prolixibacteraceae bacterium]HCR92305.1 multidrug ABC transporter permease [Prolixibacteraceae bacterium]
MKRFIGFLRKEFMHILRDKRTMIIIFGLPIAQLLIFGKVISTDIKDTKIAIYDPAQDETSREITSKLLSSGYFLLEETLDAETDYEAVFRKGKVKMIVVFEPSFDQKLEREGKATIQLIADSSDPNVARMLTTYASGIINDYVMDEKMPEMTLPHEIVPEVRMLFNEDLKSVYMYVPGIMAMILMLISAMMTSVSIAREKELGTMEILLASPLKPIQIVLGKVAPYMVISIINAIVIIVLGVFVFGVPVLGSVAFLMLETLLFILLALSLGILISTIAPTQLVAMFISVLALMLPTIILSGFIFQVENMPTPLRILSTLMPPRWFIIIIKSIMLKGVGIAYVWKETLILIIMTVVFIGLSVRNFKTRLE